MTISRRTGPSVLFGWSLLLVIAALAVGCGSDDSVSSAQGSDETADPAGITVIGSGEVLGQPDTMTLQIGVSVTRPTVADASDVAAAGAAAVIAALEADGVDTDDIATSGLAIYPQYDFTERGRRLIGFTVANNLAVKIRDIDDAGEVIDGAVAAGGDDVVVGGIGFSAEDDAERLEAARARAWEDAERKARQLAELAGVSLGSPTRIVEGLEGGVTRFSAGVEAGFDEAAATPIQPGQITTRVTLEVVFGIG